MPALLRPFSADVEALAADWRKRCETAGDEWKLTSITGEVHGEAAGYFVTSGTVNGYAKPSKIDNSANSWPRAAHEKIAANLAFEVGLPLPPVLLHRWSKPPKGDQPLVAISLQPFLNVHKWKAVEAVPAVCQQMKLELKPIASALVPFDTWLDNSDRPNNGNLIVSKDSSDPAIPLRLAYIDYANSMLCVWRNTPSTQLAARPIYPTDQKDADVAIMEESLKRIEGIGDTVIQDIVAQIPDDFATPDQKKVIVVGLLHRKSRVRAVLKPIYGGLA